MNNCCECRKKHRDDKEFKDLINRLSRIEGQVRGIRRMLEEDAYCVDILMQASAAQSAMGSFGRVLLENHVRTCVVEDIKAEKYETVDELVGIMKRMMK